MRENIPEFLWNLLTEQYGEELAEKITDGYVAERAVTLRVNRLKATPEEIKTQLSQVGIAYEAVDWSEDALIICGARVVLIRDRSSLIGFMMRIALRSMASSAKPIWSKSDGEKKE